MIGLAQSEWAEIPLPAGLTGPDTNLRCQAFSSVSRPRNLEGPVPGPGTGRIGSSLALRTPARDGPPPRVEPSSSNGRPRGTSLLHRRSCRRSASRIPQPIEVRGALHPGSQPNGGNPTHGAEPLPLRRRRASPGFQPNGGNPTHGAEPLSTEAQARFTRFPTQRWQPNPRHGFPAQRTETGGAAGPRTVDQDLTLRTHRRSAPALRPPSHCGWSRIKLRPLSHACGVAAAHR